MIDKLTVRLFCWLALVLTALPLQANPKIEHWLTQNGARVYFVHAPEIPILDVKVVFDAGSARDGSSPGLASMTNQLLTQGAGEWDSDQIADRLAAVGADLSTASLRDMASASLRVLTEQEPLATGLETLGTILGSPRFSVVDLERVRSQMLSGLAQQAQTPSDVASRNFYQSLFADHPYGIWSDGEESSVKALQREDLVRFHQTYYVAGNATIAMVGAISAQDARRYAEQLAANLATGDAAPALPQPNPLTGERVQRVTFPSAQTHLLIGQTGMSRNDPDYFSLYVGNHILGGGGLVSLLSDEIREQRGLAYSVYSYFLPMRVNGAFVMGLQTKSSQAEGARKILLDTLRKFIEQGPSAEELDAAKANITGSFPLRIASNSKILDYLAMIGFYRLPLTYLDDFKAKVDAINRQSIRDAFQRRIDPDKLLTVAVGAQSPE